MNRLIRNLLACAPVALAALANGCAQFPSVSRPPLDVRSTDSGSSRSLGVMQLGDDPDAFQSTIDPARRRSNVLLTRAQLAISDGETDAAMELLEGILKDEPRHAQASHLIAILKTESGDLEAADGHFRTALSGDGDNAAVHCDYGYFCYLIDRWDDADRHLMRAMEIDPGLAAAQTNLGMIEARRGNERAAEERFRAAGCTEADVLNNLALARFLEQDFTAADRMYRQAQTLDPEHRRVNSGLRMVSHMSSVAGGPDASSVSYAAGTVVVGDPSAQGMRSRP